MKMRRILLVFAISLIMDSKLVAMERESFERKIISAMEALKPAEPTMIFGFFKFLTDNEHFALVTSSDCLDEETTRQAIQYIKLNAARIHDSPEWWVVPRSKPGNLADLLKSNGFTLEKVLPAMIFDLEKELEEVALPGMTIKRLESSEIFEWADMIARGFGNPAGSSEETRLRYEAALSDGRKQQYVGYYKNEMAASGCILIIDDYAYLYNIVTAERFRRKGIATHLTNFLLRQAQKLGLRHLILITGRGSMGEKVYTHLGFKTVFNMEVYMLKKSES